MLRTALQHARRMPLVQGSVRLIPPLEPPVEIIGISQNSVSEHREFKENFNSHSHFSDPDRMVAESFKVPVHLGAFPRNHPVIGPDNTIHHVYDWLFRPRQHVANILSALSSVTN